MRKCNKVNLLYLTYRKKFKEFNDEINASLKEYGLTTQHAVYLMTLESKGELTQKELNDNVGNDGAITTRIIKKLETGGYVARVGNSSKKYKLSLTKLGEKVADTVLTGIGRARKLFFKNITLSEFKFLYKIAEKLS